MPRKEISRRDFLLTGLSAATAALLPGCTRKLERLAPKETEKKNLVYAHELLFLSPWAHLPIVGSNFTAPPPPPYYNPVKKGLGATYVRPDATQDCSWFEDTGAVWWYNWGHRGGPEGKVCEGMEYVLQIWNEDSIGADLSHLGTPGVDWQWAKLFNEPGSSGQANMTFEEGADYTYQAVKWLKGLSPDIKIASPAVADISWLEEMMSIFWDKYGNKFDRFPFDAIDIHAYGAHDVNFSLAKFRGMVAGANSLAEQYDIPEIWVSEFALVPCWQGGYEWSNEYSEKVLNLVRYDPLAKRVKRIAHFQLSYDGTEPWQQKLYRICMDLGLEFYGKEEFERINALYGFSPYSFGPYCNTSLRYSQDGTDPLNKKPVVRKNFTPLCRDRAGEPVGYCK
jgi:hypothetical protein